VEDFEGLIIFVRTKSETENLAEKLRARGYAAAAISGDVAQAQRERTVNQLKSGKLDILVATDVAARGLDVDRITHVVNFDIPVDTESYVHRIGRTGRAGRSGAAISFVTPRERRLLTAIEKATRQPLTEMTLPSIEDVNVTRLTRFDDAITAALESRDRIEAFRDIIAHYVEHHDVPEQDVAAALAVVAQGDTPLLLDPAEDALRRQVERDQRRDERKGREREVDGGDRRRRSVPMTPYRIEVGRRHRVEPRQIVGALANEGGLRRDDFGAIRIQPDFSIVELPTDMPGDVIDKLSDTRISGRLIEIKPDRRGGGGGYRRGPRDDRDDRRDRDDRPARKPRY
ncbi:MAG: helicase-related protein, partial [Curtobacterium sp.]